MKLQNILRVLLFVFLVRFALALLPSFQVDMGAWLAWANRLASLGFSSFYSDTVWTQYTPGYLYWLWIIGKLSLVGPLAIKVPVILADMLTGYLIWKIVKNKNLVLANVSFLLYTLNPIVIFDGSVWGQIDGILAFFMILSAYLLVEKNNFILSWMAYGIALLIKPQAIAILPIFFLLTFYRHGILKTLISSLVSFVVMIIGYFPFYPLNPFLGMIELLGKMGDSYPFTSLYALNAWTFVGMWKPDEILYRGLTYFVWGTIFMSLAYLLLIFIRSQDIRTNKNSYLLLALSCFIFFLFPTRVHERYLFPVFSFLLASINTKNYKYLLTYIVALSFTYLINLYLPYSYYESPLNPLKNTLLETNILDNAKLIALIQIFIFMALFFDNFYQFKKLHYFQLGIRKNKVSQ